MTLHKKLKNQHEESVAKIFIELYNKRCKFLRHGNNETEPDCIFEKDGLKLGVEVVTAYFSESIAKKEWDCARSIASGNKPVDFNSGLLTNPKEGFLERIQAEVDKKAKKNYGGVAETVLCIEERNPLSERLDIEYFITHIKVPKKHKFLQIFLLHLSPMHEDGEYKIFKLA